MNFWNVMNTAITNKLNGGTALLTALGGTATGGSAIYYKQARDNAPKPYIVWNWQSAVQENITPSRMWNNIINIRCFTSTPSQAGTIDGLVDDLFNGTAFTITGWTNFWTARENAFADTINEPNGEKTHVAGGLYRIRTGQ